MANTNPTQTAYDRIQRAGTRSPMTHSDGTTINYQLRKEGIRVSGHCGGYMYDQIVSWTALACCEIDPLMEAHNKVAVGLRLEISKEVRA